MIEDMSYAQLRNMQNSHISKSFGKLNQKESENLLQVEALNAENLDIDTQSEIEVDAISAAESSQQEGVKAHEKQLVSE